jgi:DNA polymerase-3 subunit gamma/tau
MRDLIERSSLGNPGRHRVFILDEVHMLSKPAEAALLKTLEEPPPHVVFVLATTDPQKVSETIRSRTQHLQFHLLPMDDLEAHVRWVIADANLTVSEDAIAHVLTHGGGSARDTLSALELVAAGGGEVDAEVSSDEFIEALIDHDPGRALAATASAVQHGTDPRTLTEEIVRHLRESFLSIVSTDLVQLPKQRVEHVADQGRRLGLGSIVRAIEVLGEALIEMRHAPDARLLLEVSLVKLTSQVAGNDVAALTARIERLEAGVVREASAPISRPAPVNPATGRAQLGGKANTAPARSQSATTGGMVRPAAPTSTPAPAPIAAPTEPLADGQVLAAWPEMVAGLKPLVRALYSAVTAVSCADNTLVVHAPNEPHMKKALEHIDTVNERIGVLTGRPLTISFSVSENNTATSGRAPKAKQVVEDAYEAIDRSELTDVPNGAVPSAVDQLAKAFPGSTVVDQPKKK